MGDRKGERGVKQLTVNANNFQFLNIMAIKQRGIAHERQSPF